MASFINFIRKIQNSPLHVRKVWLVVFTVPTMALVILLWVSYMHAAIGGGVTAVSTAPQETTGAAEVMGTGMGVVRERLTRGLARVSDFVKHFVGSGQVIEIEVPQGPINFMAEGLEAIPRTKLP